ncbi:MAG: phytanoyl-CoA dioxygenase family protein [Verrucomicrobiales bacterium]|nr:phytanoyl-CoA dioxygenase family protein [Verrucomicrobiales bacterium]
MSTSDLRADFERDGFVSLPGFLGPEEIAEARENLERFIRDVVPTMSSTEVYRENVNDESTLKQLQKMGEHDSWFGELMRGERFCGLAESLLGEPARPVNLQYFNKPPGVGQPTPPHQDGYYFHLKPNHAVTMWLALEDVGEEQGCVRYVRGSNHFGMRAHGKSGTLGFSQGILDFGIPNDLENEVAFPCKAGHLIAHHSLTIHRADGNRTTERTRQALGFVYFAESCGEDVAAKRAYQERLDAELKSKGAV